MVDNPDRAALVALYEATDGPNWVNSDNWLSDAPLGEWYGVRTDLRGRVWELSLNSNELFRPDPPGNRRPSPTWSGCTSGRTISSARSRRKSATSPT